MLGYKQSRYFRNLRWQVLPSWKFIYKKIFHKWHPNTFKVHGIEIHLGRQGQGKTYSAVRAMERYMFKKNSKVHLITNLDINWKNYLESKHGKKHKGIPKKLKELNKRTKTFESLEQFRELFNNYDNGKQKIFNGRTHGNGWMGTIFLIDEAQVYMNAQDSKDTPKDIFKNIFQLRKRHRLIICTSQVYKRLGIALKEQSETIVINRLIGGLFGWQKGYDAISFRRDEEPTEIEIQQEENFKAKRMTIFPKFYWINDHITQLYQTGQVIKASDHISGFNKKDTKKYNLT